MSPHENFRIAGKPVKVFLLGGQYGNEIDQWKNAEASSDGANVSERHVGLCTQVDPVQAKNSKRKRESKNGGNYFFVSGNRRGRRVNQEGYFCSKEIV